MKERKQTILIVDDVPANIEILGETLSPDYEVLFAVNAGDALEVVSKQIPDMVLLDIIMPEMDGYDLCRILKKAPQFKDIPIIFLTTLDVVQEETKGLELGAVDYITKPFIPSIVKLRVKNHLELKQKRDALEERNKELQKAMAQIKTLSGLIPICSSCKKIRDDKGYWNQLETYIHEHSDADFSHGICPECIEKLYPEYHKRKMGDKKE